MCQCLFVVCVFVDLWVTSNNSLVLSKKEKGRCLQEDSVEKTFNVYFRRRVNKGMSILLLMFNVYINPFSKAVPDEDFWRSRRRSKKRNKKLGDRKRKRTEGLFSSLSQTKQVSKLRERNQAWIHSLLIQLMYFAWHSQSWTSFKTFLETTIIILINNIASSCYSLDIQTVSIKKSIALYLALVPALSLLLSMLCFTF